MTEEVAMLKVAELQVAVDYDGTIMEFPETYRKIIYSLRAVGADVTVMTGRTDDTRDEDIARIKAMGFRFERYITSSEFNEYERQLEKWANDKHISIDRDEIVCAWKAREIQERGFDVVFDDAADKIRLYMDTNDPDKAVLLLKSPTEYNQVFTKWGKAHLMDYGDDECEISHQTA